MLTESEIVKNIMSPFINTKGPTILSFESINTRKLMETGKPGDYFVTDHSGMSSDEILKSRKRILSFIKNHKHKYPGIQIRSKFVDGKTYTVMIKQGTKKSRTTKDIVQNIMQRGIPEEHFKNLTAGKSVTLNVISGNPNNTIRSRYYHWGMKNSIKIGTSITGNIMTVYPKN